MSGLTQLSMFLSEEPPANPSQSLDLERDWLTRVATSCLPIFAITARYRPRWLVWENVPGVLSSNEGRDFGSLLAGMAELGYGFAYRVLDAQYFNLAQRRERVFVVGCLGDWRSAAAVLFERSSLHWNLAPSRTKGKDFTHELAPSIGASGRGFSRAGETRGQDPVIAHALRADGFDASEDGTGRGTPLIIAPPLTSNPYGDHESREGLLVPIANSLNANAGRMQLEQTYLPMHIGGGSYPTSTEDLVPSLTGRHGDRSAVAFAQNSRCEVRQMAVAGAVAADVGAQQQTYVAQTAPTLMAGGNGTGGDRPPGTNVDTVETLIAQVMAVRRLTPRECERLQGYEDDYTLITYRGKPAADGPRYKALGNSMARPVMTWIGKRIDMVRKLTAAV